MLHSVFSSLVGNSLSCRHFQFVPLFAPVRKCFLFLRLFVRAVCPHEICFDVIVIYCFPNITLLLTNLQERTLILAAM